MRYWELHEAGIRTAEIDLMAKKAIRVYAGKLGGTIYKYAETKGVRLEPEEYDERWFKFYDDAYQVCGVPANRLELATMVCRDLSEILTRVVRQYMQEKYKGVLNGTPAQNVSVFIECNDITTDGQKDRAKGYYATNAQYIKVFVKESELHEAMMGLLHETLFGDAETNGADLLVNTLAPTFAHEYAHFEQFTRKTGGSVSRDTGYITAGVKGRGGKGKRGGVLRHHDASHAEMLRYYGASHEIDSFAAGCASEMVEAVRESTSSWMDFTAALKDCMTWIGSDGGPQTNSENHKRYENILYDVAQGYYDAVGVRKDQVEKVYRRFRKLVYQKLLDYMEKRPGKSTETGLDPAYVEVADKLPRAQAVKEIAEIAAIRAAFGSPEWEDIVSLLRGNYEIIEVMKFLSQYYYGVSPYAADEHPGLEKMLEYTKTLIHSRVTEKKLEQQREAREREQQSERVPELAESVEPTLTLWHGGRDLEFSHGEVRSHKGGQWEHGPGLYLTTRMETAARYAKGGGKLYRVTIRQGTDINEVEVPLEDAVDFVNRYCIGTKRRAMIADLQDNAQRVGVLRAEVLVNLCLNNQSIQNTKTGALRQFLIDHGVDYSTVKGYGGRGDETIVVVINPQVIERVEAVPVGKVPPDDYHLSPDWK